MRGPAVLVVDAVAADRELMTLLLERQLPSSTVRPVGDALAFAEAIYSNAPDVVIVSDCLPWAPINDVVALLRRRHPGAAAIVVAGSINATTPPSDRGVLCDAWLLKTSDGLLRLPRLTNDVLGARAVVANNRDAARSEESPRQATPEPNAVSDVALLFSHDLREPLQQIERLVRAKAASDTDPGTSALFRRVLHCAERANTMLGSAVEYLSIDRRPPERRLVDLNVCLQQALDNLRIAIEESHALVRAGDLPVVLGDGEQLVHLFQNLISNAIKFRGPEIPVVTIGCENRGDMHALVFRDNGIGIPPSQAERIFGVRARLPASDHIPGTGLGLALCRAIVQRHGGNLSLETGEAQGSTFVVTLPRAPRDSPGADASGRQSALVERARIDQ
jgi:signal transduction histidine kinase